MRTRALASVVVMLAASIGPIEAQSLFNSAGLGVPTEALDGRARALGNLGIGLRGGSFMPSDPAALARIPFSTGIMVAQPSWTDYSSDAGFSGDFQGTRFPLLGLAYPLAGGMMSIQIGSFLDQTYQARNTGSVNLGSGPLATTDDFEQEGSVSNLNVGYARIVGGDISVGVSGGRYAGSVVRTLVRSFGDESTDDVDTYQSRGTWSYAGYSLTAGAAADVSDRLRLAASIQVPTKLDAEADADTEGQDRSFDLPIQYRVGASLMVGSSLVFTGSAAMADWSDVADDLTGLATAGNSNGFGVGVELTRAQIFGKDAPLRFGFRRTGVPFSFDAEQATERIFSAGFGLALNTTQDIVLAGVDFAMERGLRSGGGVTESFWRATLSFLGSGL